MRTILSEAWIHVSVLFALQLFALLIFRERQSIRLALGCIFFAALTALLLLHRIPPYSTDVGEVAVRDLILHGAFKTIWWISGAMVLENCVRLFLILERKPREGRLLQDLVVALIYLSSALCIVAYVFRLPVGTIIATSGVFAVVLGLALQSTLNDVFSGIALNLNRLLSVGDWVVLDDDVQGKVLETNWRSTQFLNATGDLVVVPNSMLAKSRITNLSVPDISHGASVVIKVQSSVQPHLIVDVMRDVLLSSMHILQAPKPTVSIVGLDRDALEVQLSFRVADLSSVPNAKNELFDLIYRHAQAFGISLAAGASEARGDPARVDHPGTTALRRLIDLPPMFFHLTEEEKSGLTSVAQRLTFKRDQIIVHKDTALTSLMILARGVAAFQEPDSDDAIEVGRLAPGDLFGERGVLLGGLEVCDIRALTDTVVYEIPKVRFAQLLRDRPALAEDLALLLSDRTKAEEAIHQAGRLQPVRNVSALRLRIRQLFHI